MRKIVGRIPPVIRFALVGLSGTVPNLLTIWIVSDVLGGNYVLGLVLGAQIGVVWNFFLTDQVVFPRRRDRSLWGRAWRFFFVGNIDLAARLPLTIALVEWAKIPPTIAAAIIILAIFGAKWLLVSKIIWKSPAK